MIPFLLIFQISRIYPILLVTIGLFVCIIITIPVYVSFHRKAWDTNNGERKLITLLPEFLRLSEKLQQTDDEEEYDNEWVVEVMGGPQEAKDIARMVGYKYIAPVCFMFPYRNIKS
ncbi:unnamed protein product [Cercopithifilaria johnstoni]|uniref:Uncharacterized protein n=1 Tax=Cercopithifilaria johnstoni TaxID=2874296 RepID=A0A8J2MD87_9BILA|nr:unnamed protein product [Cercopithifilaria johnstoni]